VLGNPDDLAAVPVRPGGEANPQLGGQVGLHHPLTDRTGRTAMGVDRPRVQGPPTPVGAADPVEDGVMHVQLRVPVARVVLQELGDHEGVRVDHRPAPPPWCPTREYPATSCR
jgi:hypothetical protein